MDALIYTLGVVVFFVGLMVSIGLHEVGHMWPAKRFDVKVTEYFVGFGRRVWSFRRGETEYGIKAIPLGGYVKLVGMLPPAKNAPPGTGDAEHPHRVRTSNTGMFTQLVADARAAEYELVQPGDEDRLFYRKPWWQKLTIMVGGLMNILIAFFLFSVLIIGLGVPTPTTTIDEVSDCVIPRRRGRPGVHRRGPGHPGRAGRPAAGRRDHQLQRRDHQLGPAHRPDPRQRRRPGRHRHRARRAAMTLRTDTTVSPRSDLDNPDAFVDAASSVCRRRG